MLNQSIPIWGCPRSILSDNGLQFFCSKILRAIYHFLGVREIATTSSDHPNGNGGVERINHTISQMLAMVDNEFETNWDAQPPHDEFAYNNLVSVATGLAPTELHIYGSAATPPPHDFRALWSHRPPELAPRPSLQSSRCWPLLLSEHLGRVSSWGKAPVFWIFLPICPALMLAGAYQFNAESPVCANPHDHHGDMPKYVSAGLTRYVLNNVSKKSPPYNVTQDDVWTPHQPLEAENITGHQSVRGRGGVIAVMHETHCTSLSRPS